MPIFATAAARTASSWPEPFRRHRFTIRADGGFLAACGGVGGPPVEVVPDYRNAVHFVDFHIASIRARLMSELGWRNLRVVEVALD